MYAYGTAEYSAGYAKLLVARKKTESDPYVFLSPEWCSAYEAAIQRDARYKQVARNWEGSVVLVFQADPVAGHVTAKYIFLDLWHGECKSLQLVPEEYGRTGEFVLEAAYQRWEQIVMGELNVVRELATRQLKLTPFDFKKAVKLAAASQAAIRLVELAGSVGARYPSQMQSSERELFGQLMKLLRSDYGI